MRKNKSPQRPDVYCQNGFLVKAFCIVLVLISIGLNAQKRFEYTHQQMGTQIRIVFYTTHKTKADSVADLAFDRIDELNNKLSDYLDSSELSLLADQVNRAVLVSDDLFRVLTKAAEISEATNGAFDITSGSLVQLWRKSRKSNVLPTITELERARESVGFGLMSFPKNNTVQLDARNMKLDLGGIGKGFAADEVIKLLSANDIHSALVDMGGDIRVSNPPPNKAYWVLAFTYFDEDKVEQLRKIRLKNAAVATSGDLYQFIEINGARYSHIINPLTGMALKNSIQVTTIAENAAEADAYASAYCVMGFENNFGSAQELSNMEVFIVGDSEKGYRQWHSSGFNQFFLSTN